MDYKKGDKRYDKLNLLTEEYVDAMNRNTNPEELHCYLRELLAEAIKMDITLKHLLKVLSGSAIGESNTEKFIDGVSKHYSWAVTAAEVKQDEEDAREKTLA
jgi:hypothetical protein